MSLQVGKQCLYNRFMVSGSPILYKSQSCDSPDLERSSHVERFEGKGTAYRADSPTGSAAECLAV